ncbi:MAG: hypothetical protein M3Q99_20205 [Acidobacteriota bacterium]|nr:hypothetical protein [Acidobacteriota bacterium]
MPISLTNGSTVNCLLDTGFNGALMFPRSFAEANSIKITGSETFTAAEETVFTADIGIAEIDWLDDDFLIRIIISDSNDALIGVEMLVDTILEIDYINSTVKITKPK